MRVPAIALFLVVCIASTSAQGKINILSYNLNHMCVFRVVICLFRACSSLARPLMHHLILSISSTDRRNWIKQWGLPSLYLLFDNNFNSPIQETTLLPMAFIDSWTPFDRTCRADFRPPAFRQWLQFATPTNGSIWIWANLRKYYYLTDLIQVSTKINLLIFVPIIVSVEICWISALTIWTRILFAALTLTCFKCE